MALHEPSTWYDYPMKGLVLELAAHPSAQRVPYQVGVRVKTYDYAVDETSVRTFRNSDSNYVAGWELPMEPEEFEFIKVELKWISSFAANAS